VVALAVLQDPLVRRWLGGVEPAWTLLDQGSFAALGRSPSPAAGPIRLASDLTREEIQQSAVARNTLVLLQAAAAGPGLKMTATGILSRDAVSACISKPSIGRQQSQASATRHEFVERPKEDSLCTCDE
jgi:hypothetical protein